MAIWKPENITLTEKGSAALTEVQAGIGKIEITRAVASKDFYTPIENLAKETSLHETLSLNIIERTESGDGGSIIQVQLNNVNVTEPFVMNQIAVFAKHSDSPNVEFLYLVAQAETGTGDRIPKYTVTPVLAAYDIYLYNIHSSDIVVNISPSGLATTDRLNKLGKSLQDEIKNNADTASQNITNHRTAVELDHPEKSVHKKHLHQDVYESPVFTDTPTAPTAEKGTSTSQIANTEFVTQAIADADAKVTERALKIAILTGTVAGGETIPLPDGYTEDQCKWIVSVRTKQVDDDDTITCHTDEHRVVTCWTYQRGNKGTVNYMIIGVK